MTIFGVEPFFDAFIHLAPPPQPRQATTFDGNELIIDPLTSPFSAYIFKIQSNMNKKHRDSMAFLRICSGKFERDMTVKHHRLGREIRLSRPHSMLAGERTTVDTAYAGDILGIINPGLLFIGDTLSASGGFNFKPLPQFPPEIFAKVTSREVGKRKAFDKGIRQLAEEGAIQVLYPMNEGGDLIFAAVGQLQFEVMQYRLSDEYGVETSLTPLDYQCCALGTRRVEFIAKSSTALVVKDRWERPMVLFKSQWEKQYMIKQNPKLEFVDMN